MDENGRKWTKMDEKGQKGTKRDKKERKGTNRDEQMASKRIKSLGKEKVNEE
jgi:hypothetical protein